MSLASPPSHAPGALPPPAAAPPAPPARPTPTTPDTGVGVASGPAASSAGSGGGAPEAPAGWLARLLRVPLLLKLLVADLLVNGVTYLLLRGVPAELAQEVFVGAMLFTMIFNAALVWWALLPLRVLESTTVRVSAGDLGARVPRTPFADRNIARIGHTVNQLLDHVTADRERMRQLASQVISAGDQERAHIARELHDSTAQSLSALEMLVLASQREAQAAAAPASATSSTTAPLPAALADRLGVMREIVVETLAEVRTLSHNVHPRVLDDLGIVSALEFLARRTRETSGVAVRVASDVRTAVPAPVASVLYRVAQEAVRNAVRHGRPPSLAVTLAADARLARLEVADDGAGFDVAAAEAARTGMGLFLMRERLALVGGRLDVASRPGEGTRVRAVAPLDASLGTLPPLDAGEPPGSGHATAGPALPEGAL